MQTSSRVLAWVMAMGALGPCGSMGALAASTSVTPSQASLNFTVDGRQQVSGTRAFEVGVAHKDDGFFCTRITSVQVIDKAGGQILGSQALARPLCNFNPADATAAVTPWSDSALVAACNGKPGQTLTLNAHLDTCTISSSLSFSIGQLIGGQRSDCGKADIDVTATLQCGGGEHDAVPIPTPAQNPASPASTTTATTTTTSTTQGNTTPPAPVLVDAKGNLGRGFRPGAQSFTLDPSMLDRIIATSQAQGMDAVSADAATLSSAYATYSAAYQAYRTKRDGCLHQTYTPAQQIATCAPTDAAIPCAEKIVAACDAAESRALDASRTAVHDGAARLAKDAQALSNATGTLP